MKKVLYAEDEYSNRKLMELLLERNGVCCDLAEDGVAALDLFRRNDYSVIILDQYMPGLFGSEVAKQIRREGSDVPLIAITSDDSQVPALKEAGFDRVFLKPMRGVEYVETILSYVEARSKNPPRDGGCRS